MTEESGLILELGDWVLRRAIEIAANWQRGSWPEVKVAINVSPRQLLSASFVDRVRRLLQEFKLPARCIELELTESVLQTGAATIESLRLLRSLDIAIALDDFGTGYSSFASLEQLPLSRIKLDRALIAGIDTQPALRGDRTRAHPALRGSRHRRDGGRCRSATASSAAWPRTPRCTCRVI